MTAPAPATARTGFAAPPRLPPPMDKDDDRASRKSERESTTQRGHYLDVLKGDQFAPEYQKLNAKAVVPTLVHDGNVIVKEKKTAPPRRKTRAWSKKCAVMNLQRRSGLRQHTRHPRS